MWVYFPLEQLYKYQYSLKANINVNNQLMFGSINNHYLCTFVYGNVSAAWDVSGRVIGKGRIESNSGIGNGNVVYGGIGNLFTWWD